MDALHSRLDPITEIDALDERASRFYKHLGFIPFPAITSRLPADEDRGQPVVEPRGTGAGRPPIVDPMLALRQD
jgi:hypothetical protein